MAREKVDNKLNVVIGTKAQIVGDTTIPENSIIITTNEIGGGGGYEPDGVTIVLNNNNELEVSKDLEVEWTKVVNKPAFSTVATTGSYNDLSGKPDLTKKLDKDFSALPNQASPLLTDVLAINRGTVAQKTTLGNLLAQVDAEIFVVVASLPTTGVVNKIYLLPKGTPESQDDYDEYIWVNNAWELIGSVNLDLSNYYNKTEADGLLSAKADKGYVDSKRAEDEISNKGYVDSQIANLETETEDKLNEKENSFYKHTAFNKNFGTTTGTVAQGNHLHTGVYEPANSNIQSHISSTSNPHNVSKSQVGLGNVDNTSDGTKYVQGLRETRANVNTKIWTGTQAQYDAIVTKDATTLYFITE